MQGRVYLAGKTPCGTEAGKGGARLIEGLQPEAKKSGAGRRLGPARLGDGRVSYTYNVASASIFQGVSK